MKMQTKTAQEGHFIGTFKCSICMHFNAPYPSVYDIFEKKVLTVIMCYYILLVFRNKSGLKNPTIKLQLFLPKTHCKDPFQTLLCQKFQP